jgi:hypothetical protein
MPRVPPDLILLPRQVEIFARTLYYFSSNYWTMRFFVVEKVKAGVQLGPKDFAKMAGDDLEYKRKLEKAGKIIGGPCL